MSGLRNQILILEDDSTLLNALQAAFSREGFIVHATSRPSEAKEILHKNPIGTLFIDCLLPDVSGVEFVEGLRPDFSEDQLDVILMSGIFTDQAFVKEALRATSAVQFLKKPFDIKDAVTLVEKPVLENQTSSKIILHPRKALYQLFSKGAGKGALREKKKTLEALDEIHGFDLPFIYSLIVESKSSGHLNIASAQGELYGITVSHGVIVGVDIPDKETYLGKLLIDSGFVLPEDLNQVMSSPSQGRKIGERLVQSSLISPHALDIILAQQMNIRLSRTIIDQRVNVNFVEDDVELTSPNIDTDVFLTFLHDWIASKISSAWLKTHFLQWSSCQIRKTPLYNDSHPALRMPLVEKLPQIVEYVTNGKTLNQILDSNHFQEEPLYKALHFLLTNGLISFDEGGSAEASADRFKWLKKIYGQLHGKNKVETFELMSQMAGSGDPEFIVKEFVKILGPQPPADQKEMVQVYSQIVNLAQQAYDFNKSGSRDKLKDEIAKGEMELKLKAASQFEEAKNLLQKSLFRQALELLKKAKGVDPNLDKIRLYLVWAKVGLVDPNSQQRDQAIREAEMDLVQVPPEEKFDAIYHYVVGLVCKAKQDYQNARKHFEKAMAIDSNMIVARRELSVLASKAAQKRDVLSADLKDLVGSFFRKK
ncbi:MAG: hypothetical protein BroJett040_24120 [Oligoflexia bacterium]|nr:MAG: hypothetical protein BroJett040_24120 [Oligoflexia bacterium]